MKTRERGVGTLALLGLIAVLLLVGIGGFMLLNNSGIIGGDPLNDLATELANNVDMPGNVGGTSGNGTSGGGILSGKSGCSMDRGNSCYEFDSQLLGRAECAELGKVSDGTLTATYYATGCPSGGEKVLQCDNWNQRLSAQRTTEEAKRQLDDLIASLPPEQVAQMKATDFPEVDFSKISDTTMDFTLYKYQVAPSPYGVPNGESFADFLDEVNSPEIVNKVCLSGNGTVR